MLYTRYALYLTLLLLVIAIVTPVKAETFLDKLPFKFSFEPGEIPGRNGRIGRPLRPNTSMDYPNGRDIWDRHPYPGNKIILTFPF